MFNPFTENNEDINVQNVYELIFKLDKKNEKTKCNVLDELNELTIEEQHIELLVTKLETCLQSTDEILIGKSLKIASKIIKEYPKESFKWLGDRFIPMCVNNNFMNGKIVKIIYNEVIKNNNVVINNNLDLKTVYYLIEYKKSKITDKNVKVSFNIKIKYNLSVSDYKIVYKILKTTDLNTEISDLLFSYIKNNCNDANTKVFIVLDLFYEKLGSIDCIENELYDKNSKFSSNTINLISKVDEIDKNKVFVQNYEDCKVLGNQNDIDYLMMVYNDNFNLFYIINDVNNKDYALQIIEKLKIRDDLEKNINKNYKTIKNCNKFDETVCRELFKYANDVTKLYLLDNCKISTDYKFNNDVVENNFDIAQRVLNGDIICKLLNRTNKVFNITQYINNNTNTLINNFDALKHHNINIEKIQLTDFDTLKKLIGYKIQTDYNFSKNIKEKQHVIIKSGNQNLILLCIYYFNISINDDLLMKIDFNFIFSHFLSSKLLDNLLGTKITNDIVKQKVVDAICSFFSDIDINNCVYFNGSIFDTNNKFYTDQLELPKIDQGIKIIKNVVAKFKSDKLFNVLYELCRMLLYEEYESVDNTCNININKNNVFLEALDKTTKVTLKLKDLNIDQNIDYDTNLKAFDVAIRNDLITVLGVIDPTYLSDESLKKVISNIITSTDYSNDIYNGKNCVVFNTITDAIVMIENDQILHNNDFTSRRLDIYMPLIDKISSAVSNSIVDNYSFSKQEEHLDTDILFDFLLGFLDQYKTGYMLVLLPAMCKLSNLWLINFIEEKIDKSKIEAFGKIATESYMAKLAIVMPRTYRKYFSKTHKITEFKQNLLSLLKKSVLAHGCDLKIIDSKHQLDLRYFYEVDSLKEGIEIKVPLDINNAPTCDSSLLLNLALKKTYLLNHIFNTWKVNYDKKLIGYTECLICFYIIEPEYKNLPDFDCTNCNNKFHKNCIYKWIGSSKTEKCPMCRVDLEIYGDRTN